MKKIILIAALLLPITVFGMLRSKESTLQELIQNSEKLIRNNEEYLQISYEYIKACKEALVSPEKTTIQGHRLFKYIQTSYKEINLIKIQIAQEENHIKKLKNLLTNLTVAD